MSQQNPPVRFKNQVDSVIVDPNANDEEQQQQQRRWQQRQQAIATNPPPAQYATRGTDTGSTHSSRPKLHTTNQGETLYPQFKDQIRENHPPLPNLDPPLNDALEETPSIPVDDPPIVDAVAVSDIQTRPEHVHILEVGQQYLFPYQPPGGGNNH